MKRVTFLAIIAIVLAAGAVFYLKDSQDSAKASYREITVQRGDITTTILTTGTVQPQNRLEIKPPIAGRIEQILVEEGQTITKGQLLAWMSSTERAALIDAARAKGAGAVKHWETLYKPTPIIAPITGTLILKNVEPGQTFTTSDPLLVLSDRLTVKALVDETDIAEVKLHQPAEIVLDAYSDEKIPGEVVQIAFEAKTVNNVTTYEVDVLPNHTPNFMKSGMTANVNFLVAAKKGVLVVPMEAVKIDQGTATVLLAETSEKRPVELGISNGKQVEIVSGLSEGDTILVAQVDFKKQALPTNPLSPTPRPRR